MWMDSVCGEVANYTSGVMWCPRLMSVTTSHSPITATEDSRAKLINFIAGGSGEQQWTWTVTVFNPVAWFRSVVVTLAVPEELISGLQLTHVTNGPHGTKQMQTQVSIAFSNFTDIMELSFVAELSPSQSTEYTLTLSSDQADQSRGRVIPQQNGGNFIENEYFRFDLDEGVVEDKTRDVTVPFRVDLGYYVNGQFSPGKPIILIIIITFLITLLVSLISLITPFNLPTHIHMYILHYIFYHTRHIT